MHVMSMAEKRMENGVINRLYILYSLCFRTVITISASGAVAGCSQSRAVVLGGGVTQCTKSF
jgi:hypothetical protein